MNKINHQILCVSCWITDMLQNDTRSLQYQILIRIKDFAASQTRATVCNVKI